MQCRYSIFCPALETNTNLQQGNSAKLPKPSGTQNLKFKEVVPNCPYNHPGKKNVFSQKNPPKHLAVGTGPIYI